MSLMTREDMLRELELLPVWQLKMQLPTIQDVAAASAEVEAPTQPVLPAVSTLPTLDPGVATAIIEAPTTEAQLIEASVIETSLIETSVTQAQATPISDKSVADEINSVQLVTNEAISEEPVSVELLNPIIEAMPQLDEPVQAPAAVAAPALRLLPFRLLVSEDTSFAFVLDDTALNGDAQDVKPQDVETLLSNMLRAMNIKCNIDLSAANTDTLVEHPVKFIIVMGESAAHSLLGQNRTIEEWRSLQSDTLPKYQNLPMLVTYHPSFLLNNTAYKANAWLDLCAAKATLHRLHN